MIDFRYLFPIFFTTPLKFTLTVVFSKSDDEHWFFTFLIVSSSTTAHFANISSIDHQIILTSSQNRWSAAFFHPSQSLPSWTTAVQRTRKTQLAIFFLWAYQKLFWRAFRAFSVAIALSSMLLVLICASHQVTRLTTLTLLTTFDSYLVSIEWKAE